MKHLKLFFALFAMLALGVGNVWGETVTYQHVFNKKPSMGNSVALSSVNWKIEATALNNYNSNNYAGVQIGSSKTAGSITLTSTTDWDYNGNGKITEVRLWLNTGGSAVTPTVTIGGNPATSDGTKVVKNSGAGSDWTKATKVTFTPVADGNTGVVVINVSTAKAGYICAMEIDCEPLSSGGDEGGNVEIVESPTFSETEVNFTEAFDLTIASAEGTTLKYTLDNSDPTTSNTAVVVKSNIAIVAVSGKSTVVKAVAVKGELVSGVKSITYCYVNSKETAYTITEALEVYNAGLGLDNSLYIQGTVKSITEMNTTQYYNANYTITDGENDLYIFRGKGIDGANFTSESQLLVGDDLVIYGKLSEYQGIPQVAQDSKIISRESKTKAIIAEDLTFDAIAIGAEVEAQTLTVTGANLTAEIAATLDNEKFTVTPATLSVDGGELTITPATDLAVGEHTATLTLTSGETTKEVALSILVKNVYTITWSVNGETSTTSVVEGDKLVLPAAPETPEACSEKVFVGWTAAEEVNADGSEIEWVTAATAPTAAATYYAVFAVQEGEGGLSEVVDVLDRALTGVEGTNYASWADVSATSDAVYAGQSAGGNEAIQLRSNNSNSGVISTTSGGKLAKVTVKWNSNTASGRTLNVFGSNTAYASPTDLYGDASGEKLGTIVNGTSTELVIEGDYAYVGLRSASGAMYLDEIQITWLAGAAATYTDYSTTCEAPVVNHTITATAGEGGTVTGLENDGVYAEGTEATLTATPNEGYEFVNWTSGETVVSTENPYKFTVTADVALVANFAKKTYTVTATAENGSVEGLAADGKYEHGATATLTATPAFDYQFVNWSNGSTENPLTITVTDNVTLEANFAEVGATEKKESGVFSISAHKTATFATGNLQHNVGTGEWRFAKQQYQVVGEQNINLGDPAFSGWIDMLGWSTNDEGNNFGVNPSNVNELYAGEFVDWGTKMGAEWSTLSADDWKYLLNTRANAADLKQVAKVGTMVGILLFPDAWTMPEGCTVEAEKDEYFNVNIYNYTIAQWNEMEAAGAVFLPAAGRRTGGYGNKINYDQVEETNPENLNGEFYRWQDNTNIYCYYWTSTINEDKNVSYLHNVLALGKDEYTIGNAAIWGEKGRYGQSVRLAKVVYDKHEVTATATNGTVTGAGTYEHGATATLTAAPAEHYVFVNWTKGEEVVAETAEYTFTVEADVELVANFKLDSHTVAATAENGTVTGAGKYTHGTEVTLTATPAEGYEFVNWTSGETVVSTENPYTFTVTADVALVANFEKVVPATETVYFINTKKWSAVKAHAWGGKATGTNWPGLATIKETEKIANNDVYSFTANVGDYANIIFNNNNQGSQTPDLVWTAGKYYVMDMGWLTKEEAEAKLAAPLPEVWNVVGDAGLMGKGWDLNAAEHAMAKQADGTYKLVKTDITITAGTYEYKAAKDHDWAVAVPQSGNQKLTISTSGVYDVTFVLDVTTKKLTATATLKQAAVVIPSVIIAGSMNSWSQEQDKFTMSPDSLTATFKTTLEVKDYEFKMIVGGAWHSDAKTITRATNSTKFTGANNNTNTTLKADVAGEYLFTWEYATKTLTVTYPARIYNINATAENGTVEGIGTYEHGDTITLIATPATGYKFRNWTTADGVVVSTEATYTFIATADVELFANFYHETTIHCVPAGDLAWYLGQALPGDTLVLADGTYNEAYSIAFNKENIVVMAAEGAKPVIQLTDTFTVLEVSATTTFDGITFDATNVAKYIIAALDSEEMDAELTITNCEFKNWTLWAISNQYANNVSVRSVVIDNCLFHDGTGAAISFSNNAPAGKQACEYFEMTNSTLYKISESSYRGIINVGSNPEAEGDYNTVVIDHITMYDYTLTQSGIAAIAIRKTHNLKISNSIIANPEDNGKTALNVYGGTVDNTIHYNGAKRSGNTVYTNCLNVDPLFVDAANGNFALMPLSPARGAATDDSDLGDPRWYTSVNKYTVTATANPAEAGTVTGAGEYIEGVEVTLVATPERGYSFVNWTVEGEEVSTEATYTFTPSADIELVANFEEIEFTGNIINVEPGAFTLSAAIEAAQPGDMIVLADGEYSEEWSLKFDKAGLIVKAAEGARPVVKIGSYMQHYATTTIIGVTFDGKFSEEKTAEHGIYSYENTSKSLTLIDCEIKNIRKYIISTGSDAHVDSLVIDGCLLHDCGAAAIYMQSQSKLPDNLPVCSYFSMINSTVYNISGTEYYGAIDIEEHEGAKGAGGTEVLIDHVTLYNFTTPQGGIRVHKSPNTTITNTIVANPTATVGTSFYVYGGTVSNSLQFNCEKRSSSSINYVDIITADPMFTHAEHGIFCLQEGSPAIGAATDGTNLGDPRWNTPHYLVELSVLNPDHGTVEGAGVYKEGETVTVVAYAKPDYKFAAWIDNNDVNEEVTDRIYSFEITGDVNLQAEFEYEEGAQGDATDIENNIISNSQVMKVIQNGRLFIIREGKIYNAQGQVVK